VVQVAMVGGGAGGHGGGWGLSNVVFILNFRSNRSLV